MKSDLSKPFFPTKKSNMKKFIFPAIAVILLIAGAIVFSALHPAPKVIIFENELHKTEKTFNKDNVKFLDEIGFNKSDNVQNNLPALYEEKAKYFKEKFGLDFYGDKVIDRTLALTGLVLGNPSQYIGKIPEANVSELKKNIQTVGLVGDNSQKSMQYGMSDFVVANCSSLEPWKVYGTIPEGMLSEETINYINQRGHRLINEVEELKNAGYPWDAQVIRASTMNPGSPSNTGEIRNITITAGSIGSPLFSRVANPETFNCLLLHRRMNFNLTENQVLKSSKIRSLKINLWFIL
jgi:hypothetical protein